MRVQIPELSGIFNHLGQCGRLTRRSFIQFFKPDLQIRVAYRFGQEVVFMPAVANRCELFRAQSADLYRMPYSMRQAWRFRGRLESLGTVSHFQR